MTTQHNKLTNDKELADKVVALGVGKFRPAINEDGIHVRSYDMYQINYNELHTSKFVRDWRVAGALMEKCKRIDARQPNDDGPWNVHVYNGPNKYGDSWKVESLPRAIIEACVEALEPVQTGQTTDD